MTTDKKPCTICKVPKPLTQFYRKKSAKDGRMPECKECRRLAWPSHDRRKKEREFLNQFI